MVSALVVTATVPAVAAPPPTILDVPILELTPQPARRPAVDQLFRPPPDGWSGAAEVATPIGPLPTAADEGEPLWIDLIDTADLDGDGHDDALTVSAGQDSYHYIARSGLDGHRLWAIADGGEHPSDMFVMEVDADGDGGHEVLHLLDTVAEDPDAAPPCDGDLTCSSSAHRDELVLTMHSGRDGQPLWTRSVGSLRTSRYRNLTLTAYSDHTVDHIDRGIPSLITPVVLAGEPALLLATRDADYHFAEEQIGVGVGQRHQQRTSAGTLTLEWLDHLTGQTLQTATFGPREDWYWLASTDDLDGDGSSDLLFHRYGRDDFDQTCLLVIGQPPQDCSGDVEQDRQGIVLLDGSTGALAWEQLTELGAMAESDRGLPETQSLDTDIDGDGVIDVLTGWRWQDHQQTSARSGADGHLLWQADTGAFAWPIGDIDGDGGPDAVHIHATIDSVVLQRRRLGDGTLLGETRHPYGERFSVDLSADHDGDGVQDLVLNGEYLDPSSSWAAVESGGDGRALWSAQSTDWLSVEPARADFDADGVEDLLSSTFLDDGGVTFTTMSGEDLGDMASHSSPQDAWAQPVSALDASPGADLFLVGARRINALDGLTLTGLW
jgi:hypothetical protein